MEGDGLGLDFALFDVDFVAAKDDGDVFADADEVTYAKRWVSGFDFFSLSRWKGSLRCQLGTFL